MNQTEKLNAIDQTIENLKAFRDACHDNPNECFGSTVILAFGTDEEDGTNAKTACLSIGKSSVVNEVLADTILNRTSKAVIGHLADGLKKDILKRLGKQEGGA